MHGTASRLPNLGPTTTTGSEMTHCESCLKLSARLLKDIAKETKFSNKTTIFGTQDESEKWLAYTPGKQSACRAKLSVQTAGETLGRCVCPQGAMLVTLLAHCPSPGVPKAM